MNTLDFARVHGDGSSAYPFWVKEPDGTRYQGRVWPRRLRRPGPYGTFIRVFQTGDGRWFDPAGMPMDAPTEQVEDDD